MNTGRAVQQLAKEAIDIQNACNLSGIVHSFSRAMTDLRQAIPDQGTAFYNSHPIAVLYASKIESLTRCDESSVFAKAYDEAMKLAENRNESGETNETSATY